MNHLSAVEILVVFGIPVNLEKFEKALPFLLTVIMAVLAALILAVFYLIQSLKKLKSRLSESFEAFSQTSRSVEAGEARFKAMLQALPIPIVVSSRSRGIEFVNDSFSAAYRYLTPDVVGENAWWEKLFPDPPYRVSVQGRWDKAFSDYNAGAGNMGEALEFEIVTADGDKKTADFYIVGLGDRAIMVVIDMTERIAATRRIERSLAEKDSLLKEIHHRVKNNLQVVISLLRLQASSSGNAELQAALAESTERLITMALVHEQLYQSESFHNIDFGSYVFSLVRSLRGSFALSEEKFDCRLNMHDVKLDLDMAVPLGLMLNELLNNSVKFGLNGRKRLVVDISCDYKHSENLLVLRYSDNGFGFPQGFKPESDGKLGLTLVRALSEQLNASLAFEVQEGMALHLSVPCSR